MRNTDRWIEDLSDRFGPGILGAVLGIAAVVAVALMSLGVALALMFIPTPARAQTPAEPHCLPANGLINGTGTNYEVFETADVSGDVGWCPSLSGGWRIYVHHFCLREVCGKPKPEWAGIIAAATYRITHAVDPVAQLMTEWRNNGIALQTDMQRWQVKNWRHQACMWLTSTQPGVTPRPPLPITISPPPVNADGTPWLPPLDYCALWAPGAQPVVIPPQIIYEAASTLVYPLNADGKRITTSLPQRTTIGTLVDCTPPPSTIPILELGGIVRYCKVTVAGVTQTVVVVSRRRTTPQ